MVMASILLKTGNWGRGDEILMSAIGREWKRQDPSVQLFVQTSKTDELFLHNPHISPAYLAENFSQEITLHPELIVSDIHSTLRLAEALPIQVKMQNLRPEVYLTNAEKQWANQQLQEFEGKKILAVCGHTGHLNRSYPAHLMRQLVDLLNIAGFVTISIGKIQVQYPSMDNVTKSFENRTSLREVVTLLSKCSAYVGVSTCFIAFSAAVNITQIVIFRKAIEPRFSSYADTFPVTADMPCDSRCGSAGGQCFQIPPCIETIRPEKIRDTVISILK